MASHTGIGGRLGSKLVGLGAMLRVLTAGKSARWFRIAFVGLSLLDAVLTAVAVPLGFVEMNPLVVRLLDQPAGFVAVKAIGPAIVAYVVPGMLLLPSVLFLGGVAAWNVSQIAASIF